MEKKRHDGRSADGGRVSLSENRREVRREVEEGEDGDDADARGITVVMMWQHRRIVQHTHREKPPCCGLSGRAGHEVAVSDDKREKWAQLHFGGCSLFPSSWV